MVDRGSSGNKPKFRMTVPPAAWTALDIVVGVALTAAVTFVIVVANSYLVGKGSYQQGLTAWLAFVTQPAILGTMVLTALVTVLYLSWRRGRGTTRF